MMQLEVCVCALSNTLPGDCLCNAVLFSSDAAVWRTVCADGAILWERAGEFLHSAGGVAVSALCTLVLSNHLSSAALLR